MSIKKYKAHYYGTGNHLHSKRTKKTFEKYGGSVNMHPDVVSYFMIHHDWKFDFFHYEKDGDIKGSYFLCNGKQIGIMARRSYPLSSDEVLIPFFPTCKMFFFRIKTNKLSIINKQNIINATWKIARKKTKLYYKGIFFHLNLKKNSPK